MLVKWGGVGGLEGLIGEALGQNQKFHVNFMVFEFHPGVYVKWAMKLVI